VENTIFIQIASYRDPELPFTLKDCIEKAKYPNNLRFCIAWQRSEQESLDEFKNDPRFNIIDIPYNQSKGACWARNLIQQKYNNEKFTLQLDSHHRFTENWDEKLICAVEKLQSQGHEKPLLTTYVPSYDPSNDPGARVQVPWKMNFDRFTPEGVVFFLPAEINNYKQFNGIPIPARFYSAHFCFTLGLFAREVQHDPEFYFHGEEISLAVRAYTYGYDLFHPTEIICWHEYTRKGRTKQWDDDLGWHIRDKFCKVKNRKLLCVDNEINDIDFGKYGLGNKRTLEDYERYAGICFKNRGVSSETLCFEPPLANFSKSFPYEEWMRSLNLIFKHCIDLPVNSIDINDSYMFWYLAFFNDKDEEIFREDITDKEIIALINIIKTSKNPHFNIWKTFVPKSRPKYWKIMPFSNTRGWLPEIIGQI
jgi:Glycosyltransferase (GlcNAc)